jgi:hypothetical protein
MNDAVAGRACLALLLGLTVAGCNWLGERAGTAQATPKNTAMAALSTVPLNLPRLQPGQSLPSVGTDPD